MNRGEFGLNLLGIEGWSTKKYTDAERERLIPQLAESEPWQTKCTIAMEECAELIQEISKMIQKGEKGFDIWTPHQFGLLEEMADVYICLRYLQCIFKYIVDMAQSYLTGNKISYACSEGYDIEAVKNSYEEQDIACMDSELSKTVNIYGRAYELIYADEDSHPRSAVLQPENAFVVYAQSVAERPLLGVYYYKTFDMQGRCTGVVCNVYDSSYLYRFEAGQDSYRSLVLSGTERHYFKAVPLIEYRNNAERQGDFEQLIPLIDAYNLLCSDRVNDKEQFVDAFLFLSGIEIDSAQAKKLKEERILMGYDGSDARYLSKVMSESDIKVLRDDLKDDIHRFSMVPDLSDESFGNNLSGVAIKYKLLGFEQAVKNKERLFAKGLKRRFELYNRYLAMLSKMSEVPVHRVEITFTYNLPANELEIAQMISLLTGTVSSETLIDRLPFVSDAKEEAELAAEEKTESYRRRLESTQGLAEGGGY